MLLFGRALPVGRHDTGRNRLLGALFHGICFERRLHLPRCAPRARICHPEDPLPPRQAGGPALFSRACRYVYRERPVYPCDRGERLPRRGGQQPGPPVATIPRGPSAKAARNRQLVPIKRFPARGEEKPLAGSAALNNYFIQYIEEKHESKSITANLPPAPPNSWSRFRQAMTPGTPWYLRPLSSNWIGPPVREPPLHIAAVFRAQSFPRIKTIISIKDSYEKRK